MLVTELSAPQGNKLRCHVLNNTGFSDLVINYTLMMKLIGATNDLTKQTSLLIYWPSPHHRNWAPGG